MNDTEFLEQIKASVARKIAVEKRLDEIETFNPIKYLKTFKERRYLKYQLKDVKADIEMLCFIYTYTLETQLNKEMP